jgi:hypothetical protein
MIGVGRVKGEARISTQGTSVALRCCLGGAPLNQGLPRPPPLSLSGGVFVLANGTKIGPSISPNPSHQKCCKARIFSPA